MNISQAGIDLITSFEGCRLTAYKPVPTETYYTIGYGHYGPDVYEGMTITQEEAEQMLVADLARYEAYVNNTDLVPFADQLNQNQFDALVSFCYNCGPGNLRELCEGQTIETIPSVLPLYNKGGGNVLKGLVRRREAEVNLYLSEVLPVLDKGVAETVINTWLKPSWQEAFEARDTAQCDYIHWLAQELRKAAGIEEAI